MSRKCPQCGARMVAYKFELKTADVSALSKMREARAAKYKAGRRDWQTIHLRRDMMQGQPYALSLDEWTNFHRLKVHGLVLQPKRGYWEMSVRGGKFLDGQLRIPRWVKTFRGKYHSSSNEITGVSDFAGKAWAIEEEPEQEEITEPEVERLLQQTLK